MERARFQRVKELFREALELCPAERASFVERSCRDDPPLALEVLDLLGHADAAAKEFPAVAAAGDAGVGVLRIPGYEVLERLASGASGSIWRARQERPRRDVAIKVLRLDSVAPAQIERFHREAQFLAELDHPGIARIIESGVLEDGPLALPWIALEFVRGVTLDEHARSSRASLAERLELHAQVCDAVEHAHRRGIVHRDLKPSNVMVDDEGRPRVIDFGIARASAALDGETALLTRTGMVIGTMAFMAPEQARGERELTPAADVYSLGAILYEGLTGRLPIDIEDLDLLDAVKAVCHEDPLHLRRLRPDLPRDLEMILAKALAKDPLRRYATAGALGADLRRHLARQPVLARHATVAYRMHRLAKRNPALCASLAALVLSLAGGLAFSLAGWRKAMAESERSGAESARSARAYDFIVAKMLKFMEQLGCGEENRVDLQETLAMVDQQLQHDPTNVTQRKARARLLTLLAQLDQGRDDISAMKPRIDAVREILEGLARERPDDLEVLTGLSAAYARSGEVAEEELRQEERDQWFERALELDTRLVSEAPADTELIEDYCWSLERVAEAKFKRGEVEDAVALMGVRLGFATALARQAPDNWKYAYNLSKALHDFAELERKQGNLTQAAQLSFEAVRQARILNSLQPGRRDAITWLVFAVRGAAFIAKDLGQTELARFWADEALEHAFELVEGDPDRTLHRTLLRWTSFDRIDLESGDERVSMLCGVGERLRQLAARFDAARRPYFAGLVRTMSTDLDVLLPQQGSPSLAAH